MTTVFVTGVGAIIGYGILRALRGASNKIRLIGADIYPDAVGQAWTDKFVVAPLTSDPQYPAWLADIILSNNIDLVIPGIEQDVHYFSDHRELFLRFSTKVVLNNPVLINLTRDKWLMYQTLVNLDSPTRIPTYLQGSFDDLAAKLGLPFIVKPRCSYASKGLLRVHSRAEFSSIADQLGNKLMAQPIVGEDEEEYTVAAFGNGEGEVCASITLQRRLASDGSTSKARVRKFPDLEEVVASLCACFKPIGPTNLQFRRDGEDWKLLEINPRISSTTSMRTAFGYNEAQMSLDFFLHNKQVVQPAIREGFAVRYIEDCVVYDRTHF